jgi:type VI secretion system secreted protein VgrG
MSESKPADTNSPVRIESSLGGDLLVASATGDEQMGRLFEFHLELLSKKPELHFDTVVGQQVTLILAIDGGERHFNGFITEFRYAGGDERFTRYQATVRPWLWFLTRTSDCQIFQNKKVPDIIKEVFRKNGMADFEDRLSGKYREWEYCVQYRESDFNFVSRLMEQEGIYYFFEHKDKKHVMVLADDISAHKPFPDYKEIPYHSENEIRGGNYEDHLDHWVTTQAIMPSKYAIQDFNFKKPKLDLLSKHTQTNKHASPLGDPEIFDYPGEYPERSDGMNYVEIRLQELQCQQERVRSGGTCRGASPGCIFKLRDYPREDQNKEHLVISVAHTINNNEFYTNQGGSQEVYRCQIEVIDKKKIFRSARQTPKPIVQGPQTAIVVGPSGEEIYTDEYGRVKVQFHWDRYGKRDENSSCWVRVSQIWAGTKWGGIHIPRIKQEVVVSFLEGDPDKPLITGSVYNADCMPPYTLEANKTQSGIKSRSTKEGGPDNFNEIRMEDKIGQEELYIQAEKDENILVKNNKGETVGNNETISIGNDRQESVGRNETISVGKDRVESVGNNETLVVANNRTRTVGVNEAITIGAAQEVIVSAAQSITVGANQSRDVGKDQIIGIGKNRTFTVGENQETEVGKDDNLTVGKNMAIDVGDSISIKCGKAEITMKKDGTITLKGKDLTLKGSGKINAKASGAVTIKGSKIGQN